MGIMIEDYLVFQMERKGRLHRKIADTVSVQNAISLRFIR